MCNLWWSLLNSDSLLWSCSLKKVTKLLHIFIYTDVIWMTRLGKKGKVSKLQIQNQPKSIWGNNSHTAVNIAFGTICVSLFKHIVHFFYTRKAMFPIHTNGKRTARRLERMLGSEEGMLSSADPAVSIAILVLWGKRSVPSIHEKMQ